MKKPEMIKARILLWDIEASNLNANFGFVFCIGWKWFGESKVNLISVRDFPKSFDRDPTDDKEVIKAFTKIMAEADIQVFWYGLRFDLPFVNTRALINSLDPLPKVPHIDGWRIAKDRLKFNSNRLDTVSRAIPITNTLEPNPNRGDERKTVLDPIAWMKAASGHIPSIKLIEDHCEKDVIVLENVYVAIRKHANNMPNLSKLNSLILGERSKFKEGCPSCGSFRMQARGKSLTVRGSKHRYQCQSCGHWFYAPLIKLERSPTKG